jgi:hypothetical protein
MLRGLSVRRFILGGLAALSLSAGVVASTEPASAWWHGGYGGYGWHGGWGHPGWGYGYRRWGWGGGYGYGYGAYGGGYCLRRVWGPWGWHWARVC